MTDTIITAVTDIVSFENSHRLTRNLSYLGVINRPQLSLIVIHLSSFLSRLLLVLLLVLILLHRDSSITGITRSKKANRSEDTNVSKKTKENRRRKRSKGTKIIKEVTIDDSCR
jgi:hypothetical protein